MSQKKFFFLVLIVSLLSSPIALAQAPIPPPPPVPPPAPPLVLPELQNLGAKADDAQGLLRGTPGDDPEFGSLPEDKDKILSLREVFKIHPEAGNLLGPDLNKYEKTSESCISRSSMAQNACLESLSPEISKYSDIVSGLAAAGRTLYSTSSNCNSSAGIFNAVQGGMVAYQAACGGAKAFCDSACSSATKSVVNIKKTLEGIKAKYTAAAKTVEAKCLTSPSATLPVYGMEITCSNIVSEIDEKFTIPLAKIEKIFPSIANEMSMTNKKSVAGKEKICSGYTTKLMTAAANAASMAALSKQASTCKKEQTQAVAATAVLDCSMSASGAYTVPANSGNRTCICQNNPRLPGCDNSLDKVNSTGAIAVPSSVTAANTGTATGEGSLSGTGDAAIDSFTGRAVDSSAGGSKGGISSGAAAKAMDGGSGRSADPEIASAKYRLGTGVFSGEGSSGSGGWGSGSRSGGSGSGLRSYLPGESKDPNARKTASIETGVTSSAGQSNFEKVTSRFLDNRPTFLDQQTPLNK